MQQSPDQAQSSVILRPRARAPVISSGKDGSGCLHDLLLCGHPGDVSRSLVAGPRSRRPFLRDESDVPGIIVEKAREVMTSEVPALSEKIVIQLPDEKSRRVGQSIAAASLPELPSDPSGDRLLFQGKSSLSPSTEGEIP